jgi:hypothetical protein
MPEAQLAPFVGDDSDAYASVRYQIKTVAGVSARKQRLALGEINRVESGSTGCEIRALQSAEKLGSHQQWDDGVCACHGRIEPDPNKEA